MRGACLFVTLLIALNASQAAAESLALEVDKVEARTDPVTKAPILRMIWTPESLAAEAEFKRLRIGETVTMRLGVEAMEVVHLTGR